MVSGKGYRRQNKAAHIERKRPKSPRNHTAGSGFGRFCVSGTNRQLGSDKEDKTMTDYPNNIPAKLEIIKASEIIPKEVRWLWYPYIPFGKVTLLQGDPGDGKSSVFRSCYLFSSRFNLKSCSSNCCFLIIPL